MYEVQEGGTMIIPMAGMPIKGLLIAPEGKYAYCIVKDSLSPDLIYKTIGTRNFGVCTKYLGPTPLLVIFDQDATPESITPLHGPNKERSVIGNVLIFGKDNEGSFRSLNDFELSLIRSHTVLLSKRGMTYFGINDITDEPQPLELGYISSDEPPKFNEEISIINESEENQN